MNEWGKADNLIEDFPFLKNNRSFSVGTINDKDGKIIGPGSYLVERVELFVNPGKIYQLELEHKELINSQS